MKMRYLSLFLLALPMMFSLACNTGDTDNGIVVVNNHTRESVKVSYSKEVAESQIEYGETVVNVELEERSISINAGESRSISVDSEPFFDGEIWVEYSGNINRYDLDYSIFGTETVHVYEEDFN